MLNVVRWLNLPRLSEKIVFAVLLLLIAGMINIFSVNSFLNFSQTIVQFIAILIGLFVAYFVSKKSIFLILQKHSYLIPIAASLLVFLVHLPSLRYSSYGSYRWIDVGVSVQPLEFFYIGWVVFLAYMFSHKNLKDFFEKKINILTLILTLSALSSIVFYQNKTIVLFIAIMVFLNVIWTRNVGKKWILILIFAGALLASLVVALKPHALDRIGNTITAYNYILDTDELYNHLDPHQLTLIEAVRNGGVFGRGFTNSYYKQGSALPEKSSDSIFVIILEEWGFLGAGIILFIFAYIIKQCASIFKSEKNNKFRKLLALAITTHLVVHITVSLWFLIFFPFTGIPFLFFSSGGSSVVATLIMVGLMVGIERQRKVYN